MLTLKSGKTVTTPKQWWEKRRPEIAEDFEREVIGRIPKNVPKVTWTVTEKADGVLGGIPVTGRVVTGHVDNSTYPDITVDIPLIVVTPTAAKTPVPLMIMFSWGNLQQAIGAAPMPRFGPPPPPGGDPPGTEQLIADGWGFAFLNPGLVQADNGAGLTKGIIGLVNKGQFRKPDDWGALRAWAWGASRALDYFETDPAVDAKHVGIDGVSRYGKAALVTMAFDPRFAMVLVGSSGEGGAKLHRRNFGEAVENLTGSGEYHWMAGNFLKYGASEATFGSKTPGDLPVDAHELIAMCAPRLTFISYGVPEKGDAKWLDQQGSFMATVAAGRVFRLLGVKDLGVGDDYRNAKMPPVTEGLLDGQLAWRQHDGGHTDGPNWKTFIAWADRNIGHQAPPKSSGRRDGARAGGSARAADRRQLDDRPRAAAREGEAGQDRRLLRRRFDRAPLGRDGLSGAARELDAELLRLERGRLRLGRRSDREHDLANRPRRARRHQPEGHRGARRHEQRRRHAGRRRQG